MSTMLNEFTFKRPKEWDLMEEPDNLYNFRLAPIDEISNGFEKQKKEDKSWFQRVCQPDYWHMFMIFVVHTAA